MPAIWIVAAICAVMVLLRVAVYRKLRAQAQEQEPAEEEFRLIQLRGQRRGLSAWVADKSGAERYVRLAIPTAITVMRDETCAETCLRVPWNDRRRYAVDSATIVVPNVSEEFSWNLRLNAARMEANHDPI